MYFDKPEHFNSVFCLFKVAVSLTTQIQTLCVDFESACWFNADLRVSMWVIETLHNSASKCGRSAAKLAHKSAFSDQIITMPNKHARQANRRFHIVCEHALKPQLPISCI